MKVFCTISFVLKVALLCLLVGLGTGLYFGSRGAVPTQVERPVSPSPQHPVTRIKP